MITEFEFRSHADSFSTDTPAFRREVHLAKARTFRVVSWACPVMIRCTLLRTNEGQRVAEPAKMATKTKSRPSP